MRKVGECGAYDSNPGSPTFGDWVKCGDFVEIGRGNDHPRYPTIYFKCKCCGKEGTV